MIMKKTFLLAAFTLCASAASADEFTRIRPVQFGFGVGASTTGVSVDAALSLRRVVQIRGGYNFVPVNDFSFDADIYNKANEAINIWNMANPSNAIPTIDDKTTIDVTPNINAGHLLLDVYPSGSFHFTVGAYFGKADVYRIRNTEDGSQHHVAMANAFIDQYNELFPSKPLTPVGMQWGNYIFRPDADGNMDVTARVREVRPYFGIGFGRAVPRRSRVGCSLDLGVQYWGKPKYYSGGEELAPCDLDAKPWLRAASTSPVYPVVTFRLCGRIL